LKGVSKKGPPFFGAGIYSKSQFGPELLISRQKGIENPMDILHGGLEEM